MIFIETNLFLKQVSDYLNEEELRQLQNFLIKKPDAGDLIQNTNGLRKLRWTLANKGKRGGTRVIYYWETADDKIYLMTIYAKNEMSDLSTKQKKFLKDMLEDI